VTATKKREKPSAELIRLAESVGRFIEYWGFKSIHGRVWTLLYLSKEPLSSIEMSRYLKVSKTLMSFSISDLLKYQVIEEAGRGLKRTKFFRANPEIYSVILNVLKNRELIMMSKILSNHQSLKHAPLQRKNLIPLNEDRMIELGELITTSKSILEAFIHHSSNEKNLIHDFHFLSDTLTKNFD
jgi:DNA-binding transcriptional regulator GbsR (MarR family)